MFLVINIKVTEKDKTEEAEISISGSRRVVQAFAQVIGGTMERTVSEQTYRVAPEKTFLPGQEA